MGIFKKHKDPFFVQLEEQSAKAEEACAALCAYCAEPTEENGAKVKAIEKEADTIRHKLCDELYNTFITPIDREDLYRLSGTIDDVTDYAWNTVKESHIYGIEPDAACAEMAETLLEIAREMHKCVSTIEVDIKASNAAAVRVKKLENQLNKQFHKAVAALFEQDDIKKILKYREVYNHMNHASDMADHAADMMLTILVKK